VLGSVNPERSEAHNVLDFCDDLFLGLDDQPRVHINEVRSDDEAGTESERREIQVLGLSQAF
jgi:hypothetical protein